MAEKKSIPEKLSRFIDKYFNLEIQGNNVICPYFINNSGVLKKPVLSGKADPYEIESFCNEYFSHRIFTENSAELIRKEMISAGIGIDCSGLVFQILNKWLRDFVCKGELKEYLPRESMLNPRKFFSRKFKPQSSVNADLFTSEPLAKKILVKDMKPGDVIRTKGGKHILFITEVEYSNSIPVKLTFVQSANFYKRTGVRFGFITISSDLNLSNSSWDDTDPDEDVNYAYKGYRELMEKNGVFRLNLPLE